MSADPWLTIIGIGEDGLIGLSEASRKALTQAQAVFGAPRHLALAGIDGRGHPWPLPFSVEPVLAFRGRPVAVLASGDPFWHGVGGSLAARLERGEWRCLPAPSTFSLAAARLGWRLEATHCLGLHAAPIEQLAPSLSKGMRAICLLRDGAAAATLAGWLTARGFGPSRLHVMEALGGPRERIRMTTAAAFDLDDIAHPVALALDIAGNRGLPRVPGLPDTCFVHDGMITRSAIRALTLSALGPRDSECLWDLGAGSGSIAVEWCLAAPGTRALAFERRADRAANIAANIAAFGLGGRLGLVEADVMSAMAGLPSPQMPAPDAICLGGGASEDLLHLLWRNLPAGTRLVANAVTLETEALYGTWQARKGGQLMRIDLAQAAPLGTMRGWWPGRPVVQWSVTL